MAVSNTTVERDSQQAAVVGSLRALQSLTIQLRVSPPLERPHIQGLLAQINIQRGLTSTEAQIQARPYQSMDWMEHELGGELNLVQPQPVDTSRACALFDRAIEIALPLVSPSVFGIHETSYQLKVFSGASVCEFNWYHKPPTEWRALQELVLDIQSIAGNVLGIA